LLTFYINRFYLTTVTRYVNVYFYVFNNLILWWIYSIFWIRWKRLLLKYFHSSFFFRSKKLFVKELGWEYFFISTLESLRKCNTHTFSSALFRRKFIYFRPAWWKIEWCPQQKPSFLLLLCEPKNKRTCDTVVYFFSWLVLLYLANRRCRKG